VLVGGLTSYWYYGFRRALLLARHRRAVLARLEGVGAEDNEPSAGDEARAAIVAAVLSRYRDWRSQPRRSRSLPDCPVRARRLS
jgi:hypothetical protein